MSTMVFEGGDVSEDMRCVEGVIEQDLTVSPDVVVEVVDVGPEAFHSSFDDD